MSDPTPEQRAKARRAVGECSAHGGYQESCGVCRQLRAQTEQVAVALAEAVEAERKRIGAEKAFCLDCDGEGSVYVQSTVAEEPWEVCDTCAGTGMCVVVGWGDHQQGFRQGVRRAAKHLFDEFGEDLMADSIRSTLLPQLYAGPECDHVPCGACGCLVDGEGYCGCADNRVPLPADAAEGSNES